MTTTITSELLAALRAKLSLRGEALAPSDPHYEACRVSWNHEYTAQPPLIVNCASTADVVAAVNFVRAHKLPFTVAGGKHGRFCVLEDHVMIYLGKLRSVAVDPVRKLAHVSGGARNGDLDHECAAYQLYTVAGTNPDTGCGGLISGGGIGYLSRQLGLSTDNVTEVEMVLYDGRIVVANDTINEDLFWAARGAAFNFGIVTRFTLRLHTVGHRERELTDNDQSIIAQYKLPEQSLLTGKVLAGPLVYPLPLASKVLNVINFLALDPALPAECGIIGVLAFGPAGQKCAIASIFHGTDVYKGFATVNQTIEMIGSEPLMNGQHASTYLEVQMALEPMQQAGHHYERAVLVHELSQELIDTVVDAFQHLPDHCDGTHIVLIGYGGAQSAVRRITNNGCFGDRQRQSNFWIVLSTKFEPVARDAAIEWTILTRKRLQPFATASYANSINSADPIDAFYGSSYPRLQGVKAKYDPHNNFRNNIAPIIPATDAP